MSAGPTRLRQRAQGVAGGTETEARFRARRRAARLRRWLRLVIPLLAVLLVASAAWVVLASPFMELTTVRVVGAHRMTAAQVRQAAGLATGGPLVRADLSAAQRRVEQLRVVRSAQVTKSWPHTVVITIQERVPVATAQTAAGGWLLLDADGVTVTQASNRPPALVVLNLDPVTTSSDTVRAVASVAAALPPSLRAKVKDVAASSPDSVRLDLVDGGLVRWGSAQDSVTKASVLAVLLTHHAHVYDVTAPGFATTS